MARGTTAAKSKLQVMASYLCYKQNETDKQVKLHYRLLFQFTSVLLAHAFVEVTKVMF